MTKRLGQMIDEGKIDLDQYLIMHPFSASTKKVYEVALRGIDFFNELYIKNNKTYERLAIISKVFNNAERNLVVVTGYRGCGKTNFLKLVQYISDRNKPLEGFEERRKKDLENTDNINDVNEKYAISLQVIKRILFNELHGLNEENSSDALTNYIYEHLAGKCKYINFDEGGIEFSGGQAQKLAIARAVYKNAPIVILDEPTASLDPISEKQIYEICMDILEDRTCIFISHRLGAVRNMDEILVVDNGVLCEAGSHEKLMQLNGIYNKLYSTQREMYIDE